MTAMFQLNHREHPPLELLLEHVLDEGQRVAAVGVDIVGEVVPPPSPPPPLPPPPDDDYDYDLSV